MKKIIVLIVAFFVVIGLSVLVVQAGSEAVPVGAENYEFLQEAEFVIRDEPASMSAAASGWGGCWYRDEFGRLYNFNVPYHKLISLCIRRGDYPSQILTGAQEALRLNDSELKAMGYVKTTEGVWER